MEDFAAWMKAVDTARGKGINPFALIHDLALHAARANQAKDSRSEIAKSSHLPAGPDRIDVTGEIPPRQNSCRPDRSPKPGGNEGRTQWLDTDKHSRNRAVARLLPPESASLDEVAREFGVGTGTLERWRSDALSRPGRDRSFGQQVF